MTEPAEVVVAIVNYCTPALTIDCLRSLEGEARQHPGLRVVVADNASPDGSGAQIAAAIDQHGWSGWAALMPLPRNGGFAYGNNAVVGAYKNAVPAPRFFWLLNSDTVVRAGATQALLDCMARNPEVGIAGSRLEDPDGTQQHSAFRFHSTLGEFEGSARVGAITRLLRNSAVAMPPVQVSARYDWLSGASMMIRSQTIKDIGLMDESYFLYFEETDFCRKASQAGWACCFVPESRIVHLVGQSTGVTERTQAARRRSSYWFESRRRYFVTHHGRLYAIAADLALAVGTTMCSVIAFFRRKPSGIPTRFLRDLFEYSAVWPMPKGIDKGA